MTDASSSTCIDASGGSGTGSRGRGRGRRPSFGDAAARGHDDDYDDDDESGGSLSASSSFSSLSSSSASASASDRRTAAASAAAAIGRRRTARLAERAPTLLPRNQATFGPHSALFPLNTGARPAARTLLQATESSYNNEKEDELLLPTSALVSQLGWNIGQSLRSISVHHGNATCNDMISGKMSDAAEAGGSPDSSTSSLSSADANSSSTTSSSFYSPGLSSLTGASSSSSPSSCPSSPSELSASSCSDNGGSPPCRHKSRMLIRPGSLHNRIIKKGSARGGRGRHGQRDGDTSSSDDSISPVGSDHHPHPHPHPHRHRNHQYGGYGQQGENVHQGKHNGHDPLCRVTEDGGASPAAAAAQVPSSCAATDAATGSIVSSLASVGTSLAAPTRNNKGLSLASTTTRNNIKGLRAPIGPHTSNGSILTNNKTSSDGATHSGASTVFTDYTMSSTDISEAAFSYYYTSICGYMRDVLLGCGHQLYCKVTRRPSYTEVVGPTQCLNCRGGDDAWLETQDMSTRERLGHNIRYGMDVLSTTVLYQWQHHWRILMLVGIMMVALGMLSYVPTYDGADGPTSPSMSSSSTSSGDDMTSSAGYERDLHQKLGLLGLIDPNSPQYQAAAPQETQDEGDMTPETDAIAATNAMPASYYSIPKTYQILMPSSFGGGSTLGASPVTNIVRLGPLKDIAYVTEEIRPNDVPFFFHIPRSAGCTLKHIIGQCLGMVISSDYGAKFGHEHDEALMVVTADHGGQYVNADTSTPHGIERAKAMGLVENNMADVVVTQLLYRAATMFNPNQRGRLFTIFRDPIERAVSMYYYLGDAEWEPTYDPVLKQIPLADYARSSRIEHNWMTRILSDTPVGPLDANHLELAKAVIRQKTLVGLLSRKSETVERFKVAFNWQSNFPEFENSVSSSTEKRNLELSQAEECQDKLLHIDWPNKHVHPRLDDENTEVYALLYEVNRFDMELYRYAERIFDEQSVLFLPGGVYYREG